MLLSKCPSHTPTRPSHTFRVLFQGWSCFSFNDIVLIQSASKVLLISYVIVRGRSVFLLSSINTSLREVIIIVAMCDVNQAAPIVCV